MIYGIYTDIDLQIAGFPIWLQVNNATFGWVTIHLPAVLRFTRGPRFLTHSYIYIL